jgi:hypothetical protein
MNDEYAILLAFLMMTGFMLSCGIFCVWFDFKQTETKRLTTKKEREYFENE